MENIQLIYYSRGGYVPSNLPCWRDNIDSISLFKPREKAYTNRVRENNITLMLRPEQESDAVMMNLVDMYSQPGDIVYDPFADSYATELACMFLPLPLCFNLVFKNDHCSNFAMRQFGGGFRRWGSESLFWYCMLMKDGGTAMFLISNLWIHLLGYPPIQLFPQIMVHFSVQFIRTTHFIGMVLRFHF